ncbi:MAG: DUF917 domain-containing protein [Candidatus Acidifodinimicrobium sp.]
MRHLSKENVKDVIVGATFLGAGGGGSAEPAMKVLDQTFSNNGEVELFEPNEISDSSTAIVSAGMGSPEILLKEGWKAQQVYAFERAESMFGKIEYVLPVETGGFNTFTAIQTAITKRRKLVDGDGAGRAIPELEQTTYYLSGIPSSPLILADSQGNSAVLYPKDAYMAENMGRAITTVFNMAAGISIFYMSGKQLRSSVVNGAISVAEGVGKVIKNAKKSNEDIIEKVIKEIDGKILGRGIVKKKIVEVKGSFDFGRVHVGDITVDYKNENMIAWKNGKPIAMVPDSICWITTDGIPLTNADIKEGLDVVVIGRKAHPKFRTDRAYDTFRHVLEMLGYKGEFKRIEDII